MKSKQIRQLKGIQFQGLIGEFFREDYMGAISHFHHKHSDGQLELYYNWFCDNPHQCAWEVYHPGYIRNEIRGIGHTQQEAIDDFISHWAEEYEMWGIDPFEEDKNENTPEETEC